MNLIYHTVQQGTDEWKEIKAGKLSGTNADTLLVKGRQDGIGTALRSLIYKKVAEWVTGPDLDNFTTPAMQRGNDLEPIARQRYEDEEFVVVEQVGYIQMGDYFGVSPDGLVSPDGAIEIKCPEAPEYLRYMDTKDIQNGHYAQMQWLMFLTDRKWCDYVVYCPEFAPMDITITRVDASEAAFEMFRQKTAWVETEMTRLLEMVAQKESA